MEEHKLPDYDELPGKPDMPRETTWGLFGDSYELGTLNFLSDDRIRQAGHSIRQGRRFSLNLPLDVPVYGIKGSYYSVIAWHDVGGTRLRNAYKHEITYFSDGTARDEVVDAFNPQGSTQWDGLGHVRHPKYGNYNGVADQDIKPGNDSKLSSGKWAEAGGIVGRGVLLDVDRYCHEARLSYDPSTRYVITQELLRSIQESERVEIQPGDVLLIRTGWMKWQIEHPSSTAQGLPGLGPGRDIARFLWQKRVAAVAADNDAVEAVPIEPSSGRSLHMALLPMLGMPMGELFYLEDLADACAADQVYDFLFVSIPLNLPGGIGSPANAVAIK